MWKHGINGCVESSAWNKSCYQSAAPGCQTAYSPQPYPAAYSGYQTAYPYPPQPQLNPFACTCPPGPMGPAGPTGPAGPVGITGTFRSSYLEANGDTQTVLADTNVVFDITADNIDIVGSGITVNSGGDEFTFTRPGLYSVEWTLNISSGDSPVIFGLVEEGGGTSVMTNSQGEGILSSGALIYVAENEVPYTISLHNFADTVELENLPQAGNSSASIRILRFADGPDA